MGLDYDSMSNNTTEVRCVVLFSRPVDCLAASMDGFLLIPASPLDNLLRFRHPSHRTCEKSQLAKASCKLRAEKRLEAEEVLARRSHGHRFRVGVWRSLPCLGWLEWESKKTPKLWRVSNPYAYPHRCIFLRVTLLGCLIGNHTRTDANVGLSFRGKTCWVL